MKKTPAFTMLFLAFALILTSCKKDSKEISILGEWHVTTLGSKFYLAGNLVEDLPSASLTSVSIENLVFMFNSDGTFTEYMDLVGHYVLVESGSKYMLTDGNNTLNLYDTDTSSIWDTYKVSFTDKNTMVLIHTINYNTPTVIGTAKTDRYDKIFTFTRL